MNRYWFVEVPFYGDFFSFKQWIFSKYVDFVKGIGDVRFDKKTARI